MRLDGTPSEDTIVGTALAWLEIVGPARSWDRDRDEPIVVVCFRRLGMESKRWPVPQRFLELIAAETPLPTWRSLPKPKRSPEELRERMEANPDVKAIRDTLGIRS